MGEMLALNPEGIEREIHPHALRRYKEWKASVQCEIPLEELNNSDLNMFLCEGEKRTFQNCMDEIGEWLMNCRGIEDGYSPYPYDADVIGPMFEVKSLLKRVYQLKAIKAKEEQRRREEKAEAERREKEYSERWCAAYIVIKPPMDDAKKYLNDEEYEKFEQATWKAIEIYIGKEEDYLNDSGTFDYRRFLWKINYRKEEEQIRNDAQAQAQAFHARLDQGLKEIENMLSPEKEDPAVIFKRWCSNNGENRYIEEPFTDILASDDDKNRKWTQGHIPTAEKELQKSIPGEFRDFILTKPTTAFFLLPSANYSYCGVPCLDFYFTVFAVVTITVLAQAGQKVFNGHRFNFLTNLREPKRLGFYQITIISNQPNFWQSVPLTMLYALIDGNLRPPGITILQRTDQLTIYEVKKFEEDICEIPISFERYCRRLGSVERMKEARIINERTAEILEPLRPISINHKESKSKKAKAFEFFSLGKRPSDSEVKNLGIKPNSTYRYYQDWKKLITVVNHSNNHSSSHGNQS
ncbi:hypothetical protein ACFLVF_03345 [Chloroflexota bacterium]